PAHRGPSSGHPARRRGTPSDAVCRPGRLYLAPRRRRHSMDSNAPAATLRPAPPLARIQAFAAADMAAVDALIRRRLASDVVLVNQVAEHIVAAGGKRLRPMLL